MTDKEVNDFLNKINNSFNGTYPFTNKVNVSESVESQSLKLKEVINLQYFEKDLELIIILFKKSEGKIAILSTKGKKVIRLGGWIEYLKREEKIEKKREEKEDFDLKISKLQAKTGLLPYFLSVIGIGISIWALVESKSNTPTNKHEQPLIKEHKQLPSKDYPTKDSLSEKGKRIDSLNVDNQ
jgi:hypothetical protein